MPNVQRAVFVQRAVLARRCMSVFVVNSRMSARPQILSNGLRKTLPPFWHAMSSIGGVRHKGNRGAETSPRKTRDLLDNVGSGSGKMQKVEDDKFWWKVTNKKMDSSSSRARVKDDATTSSKYGQGGRSSNRYPINNSSSSSSSSSSNSSRSSGSGSRNAVKTEGGKAMGHFQKLRNERNLASASAAVAPKKYQRDSWGRGTAGRSGSYAAVNRLLDRTRPTTPAGNSGGSDARLYSPYELASLMNLSLKEVKSALATRRVVYASVKDKCATMKDFEQGRKNLTSLLKNDNHKEFSNRRHVNGSEESKRKAAADASKPPAVPIVDKEKVELDSYFLHSPQSWASSQSSDVPLKVRPPVISVMGHVDHGKTTLLDCLRNFDFQEGGGKKAKGGKGKKGKKGKKQKSNKSSGSANGHNVAGTEAGGITQVISSFSVDVPSKLHSATVPSSICFLDTPGHSAFKSMRSSSGNATDIICLVVAGDDGVNDQTKEVVKLALEGGVQLLVAVTKVDRPEVDEEEALGRVSRELMEIGVTTELNDGDVVICGVSGITGAGVYELIENLVLQSEIMELKCGHDTDIVEAVITDANVSKGLGVVADAIVKWGTLGVGDCIVTGVNYGKVKILKDSSGRHNLKTAGPSTPIRIVGLRGLPKAGDRILKTKSDAMSKTIVERRLREISELAETDDDLFYNDVTRAERASAKRLHLEVTGGAARSKTRIEAKNLAFHKGEKLDFKYNRRFIPDLDAKDRLDLERNMLETPRAPVVIKADCEGTLQAVKSVLIDLQDSTTHDIEIDIIHVGVGPVTPSDVSMAKESSGVIFAFGVGGTDKDVVNAADADGVPIRRHDIIYGLLDDAKVLLGK